MTSSHFLPRPRALAAPARCGHLKRQAVLAACLLWTCSFATPAPARAERPLMAVVGGGISPVGVQWLREGSVSMRHVANGPRLHAGLGVGLTSRMDLQLEFGISSRVSTRMRQRTTDSVLPAVLPPWERFLNQDRARLFDLGIHPSFRWPLGAHLDAALRIPLGGFTGTTPPEPFHRVQRRVQRLRGLYLGALAELRIVPRRSGVFSLRVHLGATVHHGWQDISYEIRGDDARLIDSRRTLTWLSPVLGLTAAFGKGAAHE